MSAENPGGSAPPPSGGLRDALAAYRRIGSHWKRYDLAGELARGRAVLDLGCGHGYGAAILGARASRYLGVDVDPTAIDWARRNVAPVVAHAEFRTTAPVDGSERFGLVTAFEVVEHVRDPDDLLRRAVTALGPGGSVVLSTPNGAVSGGDPRRYRSPFHVREYATEELDALLRSAGLRARYFRERRRDRLDALALRWRLAEAGASTATGARGRGFAWFARHFDGPGFWSIVPTPLERMGRPDFSTIVAVASPG